MTKRIYATTKEMLNIPHCVCCEMMFEQLTPITKDQQYCNYCKNEGHHTSPLPHTSLEQDKSLIREWVQA